MKRKQRGVFFAGAALLAVLGLSLARAGGGGSETRAETLDGGRVACANLVYAGHKTSICFSDRFLKRLEMETKIRTDPRFHRVRLDDAKQLADYPFAIMTGEGGFTLTERERMNLRRYLSRGGFLVASAGCSDPAWARSFRAEFARLFPGRRMQRLPLSHPLFRMVYLIRSLDTTHRKRGPQAALDGFFVDGKIALVFSPDGLNDTAHAENCCCCGGDELANAEFINVNLLAYALLH